MAWTWRYHDAEGAVVPQPAAERFPTQSDAESWLGESWRALLDEGVHRVALLEEQRVEYEMPLTPAL